MHGQAVDDLALMREVAQRHERLLKVALGWRKDHPGFTFALRTRDNPKRNRLEAGYWFQGNEYYLFFAPFKLSDSNNKTRTIGLVFSLKNGQIRKAYIEIVYGSIQDPVLCRVHERLLQALGMEVTPRKECKKTIPASSPEEAFVYFMNHVYPVAQQIIADEGVEGRFFITQEEFESAMERLPRGRRRPRQPATLVDLWKPQPPASVVPVVQPRTKAVNTIYYGPPGTGKTRKYEELRSDPRYRTEAQALSADARDERRVGSAPWHAVVAAALLDLGGSARVPQLRTHAWVQASARLRGRPRSLNQILWGQLQSHAPLDSATVRTSARTGAVLFDKDADSVWRLLPQWRDNAPDLAEAVDAIVDGLDFQQQANVAESRLSLVTFHPSYSYEDFVEGIRPVPADSDDGRVEFRVQPGLFKELCRVAHLHPQQRYALFIDEINRANLAKVFGELIALIEPDKRVTAGAEPGEGSGLWVQLPASHELFGVPDNLDLYATMNTADRSIALMDLALRRRFRFEETPPLPEEIKGGDGDGGVIADGVRVDLPLLLRKLNQRIEYLLDRDHCIGHAYFLDVHSLDDLRNCFRDRIIPLLQEYFFDDWGRIQRVLGSMGKADHSPFVEALDVDAIDLFGVHVSDLPRIPRYRIELTDASQNWSAADFRSLYSQGDEDIDDDEAELEDGAEP